jgi:predicted RNA-binding protein YlqC (UPF0109 family)
MKKLLTEMTKAIVDNPDEVKVEDNVENSGLIILNLSVDSQDIGRIIGKQGRMINAIRNLMRVAARKQGKLVRIELNEPPRDNPGE